MDSDKRAANSSNDTGHDARAFEDWADQFRKNLKEKEADTRPRSVSLGGGENGRKFNRLFFIVIAIAGALFVTLSLFRIL